MTAGSSDILVIDTANRIDQYVRQRLLSSGFNLHTVAAEDESLSYIRHHNPDLLLVCQGNPSNGLLGFVKEIRAIRLQLPIVLLLTAEELPLAVPVLEQGVMDYALVGADDLLLYVIHRNLRYSGIDRRVQRHAPVSDDIEEKLKLLVLDQQAGFRVQHSMMPESPITIGNVRLDHRIFPSLILSGDFVDYFALPDGRVLFYLADVSGHGASSAFVTVLLRSLSRRLEMEFSSLGLAHTSDILTWVNDELLRCELEHHVTMFLGIIDTPAQQMEYSNAAHFPAAILSGDGDTDFLQFGGRPLGLFKNVEYVSKTLHLPDSYTLVMFSDGVFEIMPQETLKDKEAHLLSLVKCGTRNVEALANHLGVNDRSHRPDDIAVFTVAGVR